MSKARELVEGAEKSDYIMLVILPFLPAILLILGVILIAIGILASFGAAAVGGSVSTIGVALLIVGIFLNFYVIYKWVKRRNEHFERTLRLYETLTEIAEVLGFERAGLIKSRLNEVREINRSMKSPVANAILTIVPFYIYYVYHFLNKDFVRHSEKERLFLAELVDELRERVPSFVRRLDELKPVPERSTLLYFILTVLLGSLFLIYWVYTLTKDPNEHFKTHRVIELDMINALETIAGSVATPASA